VVEQGVQGLSVLTLVIAGLDPAIHHFAKKMDARVTPGHDDAAGPSC
jgi:hypothetical protein